VHSHYSDPLLFPNVHFYDTIGDGDVCTLDLQGKWSTTIVKELMDVAGGSSWQRWKDEVAASGLPLVPGEDQEGQKTTRKAQRIFTWKKLSSKLPSESQITQNVDAPEISPTNSASPPKVGAAAVLP